MLLPEYIAQWAGVCIGTVTNATYHCLVAFLALLDDVVMISPEEEKEWAKEYVEKAITDGTKFVLFQKSRLHGKVQ